MRTGMARMATQKIALSDEDRERLTAAVRASTTAQRVALRSRIILTLADGKPNKDVAQALDISEQTVCHWRKRFCAEGMPGLQERSRSGRPASIGTAVKEKIITGAVGGKQSTSCRKMANAVGVSKATVQRLWAANDIKPHLIRTFKLSNDPHFEEKFWDVIGLYLNPPEHALVLCCDEKSQCQALERTQPGLPLGVGHIRTQTHDYYRHGTTTLFAALNYLEGKIIGRTEARHTHVEWLRFLKQIDRETPKYLTPVRLSIEEIQLVG
jgi:transposase